MTNFELAYSKLNQVQRQAVDTIDGPVLVLAGPGTGKTQVLTLRIANILKNTDTDPGSILALTFTESATREMRERLIKLIGKDGYYVQVTTFHGFCNDIIASNPERFSKPSGMQNVTDLEKIQIIKEILEDGSYEYLKPLNDPLYYAPYIISSLSTLKREGFPFHRFGELVSILKDEFEIQKDELGKTAFLEKQKQLGKNLDLLDIYEKYQKKLIEKGRFDFDDMINWVVESFESDNDFLLGYQEKFQYLLVDEYQDTNSAQNRLLFALANFWGEEANLFAVGDANQSIYRFNGASKENLEQFKKAFPKHASITLTDNYRSTGSLLKSSASLIGEKSLQPNVDFKNQKIKIAKFTSSLFEDEYLLKTVEAKIKSGQKPKDIAVIVKENKDIENLVNLFKQKNLPFRLEAGSNVLTAPYVSQFLKLLKVITTIQDNLDDLDLFIVLNYPYFHLEPLKILQLSREAYISRQSLADILIAHNNLFFNQLITWNSQSATKSLPEIFQIIFQESGFLDHLLSLSQPMIEFNRLSTLFDDVKIQSTAYPDLTLKKYLQNLQVMQDNNIKLEEQVLVGTENAVTLTTAHKSKGLEWQTVFIYRFADTHWGNKTRREMIKLPPGIIIFEDTDIEEEKNSEERRLFYVALTRAKEEIFLTGAAEYSNSAKMIFPSIFLEDLPNENLEELDTTSFEKDSQQTLVDLLSPPQNKTIEDNEEEYLHELLTDFKLSPTALNTYLSCHYKFKLDNLYRIPRAKAPSMCFGTAVHAALEKMPCSKEIFLSIFEFALRKEIMTKNEFSDRLAHGQKILSLYYDQYQDEFGNSLYKEKSFGTSLTSQIHLDDIALTGKADRIDFTSPSSLRGAKATKRFSAELSAEKTFGQSHSTKEVCFIDYKTGKPKSRNEIEGNTQNSNGDYKRQLVFYKLLSELDKSFPYEVTETEIDFVEPDAKGQFKKEKFSITSEEVNSLKALIKDSVKSIRSLDFSRTSDTATCQTCPFLSHCWPNTVIR